MKYDELKSTPQVLAECREVINHDAFKNYILPMLIDEHPGRTSFLFQSNELCAAWQREATGYEKAIKLLLGILLEPSQKRQPKSTYSNKK